MTISLNQAPVVLGAWSGAIPAAALARDTLYYVVTAYSVAGAAMSSSAPLYNGVPVVGAVLREAAQSPGSGSVYTAIWRLPNVPAVGGGGAVPVSVMVTGADIPGDQKTVGLTVYDAIIPGTPTTDQGNAAAGDGTAVTSGASGPITELPELVIGSLVTFGQTIQPVGAPWTEPAQLADQFQTSGYQIPTSGTANYTYAQTSGAASGWAGAIITDYGVSSSGGGGAPIADSGGIGLRPGRLFPSGSRPRRRWG